MAPTLQSRTVASGGNHCRHSFSPGSSSAPRHISQGSSESGPRLLTSIGAKGCGRSDYFSLPPTGVPPGRGEIGSPGCGFGSVALWCTAGFDLGRGSSREFSSRLGGSAAPCRPGLAGGLQVKDLITQPSMHPLQEVGRELNEKRSQEAVSRGSQVPLHRPPEACLKGIQELLASNR